MNNALRIEHHPENGHSPWVVVSDHLWFAYRTREDAEEKLKDADFVAFAGMLGKTN